MKQNKPNEKFAFKIHKLAVEHNAIACTENI